MLDKDVPFFEGLPGPNERRALERRRDELRMRSPHLSAWEGRELDNIERRLGPDVPHG